MSARVIARGTWLRGTPWHRAGRDQFPIAGIERLVHALPAQLRRSLQAGMAELQADLRRRLAVHEVDDALPGMHLRVRVQPAQPGVMRPCGVTQVISVNTRPAPPSARAPRCTRWKSFGMPSAHCRSPSATPRRGSQAAYRAAGTAGTSAGAARFAVRANGTRGKPALHALEPRAVTQAQVLVADALAARQQAVGELLRLQVRVAGDVLEPFGRVARGGLQFQHFDAASGFIAAERRCNVVAGLVDALGETDGILQRELGARSRWRNARCARRRPSARRLPSTRFRWIRGGS